MRAPAQKLAVVAAAVGLVGSTLLPVGTAGAATSTISVNPSSANVGSVLTITSACTEPLAGGTWLPAQVGLYFADAFTDNYGKRSVFTSVTAAVGAGGTVVAKITVPAKGTYTPGTGTMPGPERTKPVAGKLGVDVVCTSSESPFPWQIVSKVDAVTIAVPALTVRTKPAISGKKKKGATLTATTGAWTPAATSFSFQWKRAGKAIAKATKKAYKVKKADKGKKLTVAVTAKRTGYRATTAVSAAVRIKK